MTQLRQLVLVALALDSPAVTKLALIPTCEECKEFWLPGDGERWRAYWIYDGDEDRLLFYCATCAEREFGSSAWN
jgi:hypothetical protein